MRKFLAAAVLATAFASPALAQSYDPELGTGNIAPLARGNVVSSNVVASADRGAASAYARVDFAAPRARSVGSAATDSEHVVMFGSRVLGRDPDPFIRSQLLRIRGGNHPG